MAAWPNFAYILHCTVHSTRPLVVCVRTPSIYWRRRRRKSMSGLSLDIVVLERLTWSKDRCCAFDDLIAESGEPYKRTAHWPPHPDISTPGHISPDIFPGVPLPDNSLSLFTWCRTSPLPSPPSASLQYSDLTLSCTELIAIHRLGPGVGLQVDASFHGSVMVRTTRRGSARVSSVHGSVPVFKCSLQQPGEECPRLGGNVRAGKMSVGDMSEGEYLGGMSCTAGNMRLQLIV